MGAVCCCIAAGRAAERAKVREYLWSNVPSLGMRVVSAAAGMSGHLGYVMLYISHLSRGRLLRHRGNPQSRVHRLRKAAH